MAKSSLRSIVVLALLLGPSLAAPSRALAQAPAATGTRAAKPFYDRGVIEYTLGHFPEAIVQFEKAYELDPAPILLFNIGQSHRQAGNDERALFFYRRYLEQAPRNAPNRPDVEKRVKDLEDVVQRQRELKQKPPTTLERQAPETEPGAATAGNPGGSSDLPRVVVSGGGTPGEISRPSGSPEASRARPVHLGLDMGPAFASFSGMDVQAPTLFAVRIFGGYSFRVGRGAIDAGASLSFSPMHYDYTDGSPGGSWSTFVGLLARAGGSFPVAARDALKIIGTLEGGVMWWGGLAENNPFTFEGVGASGAIPMPTLRIGLGLQYDVNARLFVYVVPTFTYSKTTSEGLTRSITAVNRIDVPLGVGWRF